MGLWLPKFVERRPTSVHSTSELMTHRGPLTLSRKISRELSDLAEIWYIWIMGGGEWLKST